MADQDLTFKALDFQMQAHDDLVGSVKLHFSFSTGAAVLLVNAAAQPSNLTPGWQLACIIPLVFAALCFAIAAVRAMRATIQFSRLKSDIARNLPGADQVQNAGDIWFQKSGGEKVAGVTEELNKMQRAFTIGMVSAIAFALLRVLAAATLYLNSVHHLTRFT
jgi:hypothetical protein